MVQLPSYYISSEHFQLFLYKFVIMLEWYFLNLLMFDWIMYLPTHEYVFFVVYTYITHTLIYISMYIYVTTENINCIYISLFIIIVARKNHLSNFPYNYGWQLLVTLKFMYEPGKVNIFNSSKTMVDEVHHYQQIHTQLYYHSNTNIVYVYKYYIHRTFKIFA